jgi:hypothetical protein
MKKFFILFGILFGLNLNAQIGNISNGESLSSVRGKLNQVIDSTNKYNGIIYGDEDNISIDANVYFNHKLYDSDGVEITGGGSSNLQVLESQNYNDTISFDNLITSYSRDTITTNNLVVIKDDTGKTGYSAIAEWIGNGTNTPNLTSFKQMPYGSLLNFDNTLDRVNRIAFTKTYGTYYYNIFDQFDQDVTAPLLTTATVENDAVRDIVLTYDENLDEASVPATTDFTNINGTVSGSKTASSVSITGTQVTITVNADFLSTDNIDFDYATGTNPIRDIAENNAANLTDQSVTNNISGADADAQAYIDTLHTIVADLGGIYGTLTDAQVVTAIETFYDDIKGDGSTTNNTNVFDSLHAFYLIIGADDTAHAINGKNPALTDAAFRLSYAGSTLPTHTSTGIIWGSGGGYANTHYVASTEMNSNSSHISYYSQTSTTTISVVNNYGALVSSTQRILSTFSSGSGLFDMYSSSAGSGGRLSGINSSGGSGDGFIIQNRETSSDYELLRNNSSISSTSNTDGSLPNIDLYIGAYNLNGTPTTSSENFNMSFISIGAGLTNDQRTDLYDAVLELQTTLLRNL